MTRAERQSQRRPAGDREPRDAATPAIRVAGLRKAFGSLVALDSLDLDVARAEILALLGPSGSGKTTLLRAVAGLEPAEAGTIEVGGKRVFGAGTNVPPERRRIGMVFQDVALFPHLSVAENVGFGVRSSAERGRRVAELLELVGLSGAGDARPHELSGGMAQRVALARALAPQPDVVLLDEPFANLDAALRIQLRDDVRAILRARHASALFVTHDQTDALTVADRVAVMHAGRIEQVGTPELIYGSPATAFVARFVGVANLVPATAHAGTAETPLGSVAVDPAGRDGPALVVIRPEHIEIEPAGTWAPGAAGAPAGTWAPGAAGAPAGTPAAGDAGVPGRVTARRFAGSELLFEVAVDVEPGRLWAEAGPMALGIAIDDPVMLRLRARRTAALFDPGPDTPDGGPEPWRPSRIG